MNTDTTQEKEFAEDLLKFLNNSPTPFHVIKETKKRLESAGFTELALGVKPKPGGKYYVTCMGSSLIAFVMGKNILEGTGFKIIGAHTDSPTLKLKPNALYEKSGCAMLGVEPYGGGIWRTWLDRDLFIAGRVTLRDRDGEGLISRLINLRDYGPIVSATSLAVHLERDVNENGAINSQTDLPVIMGLGGMDVHDFNLLFKRPGETVMSTCLFLCDTQEAVLGGMNNEIIHSSRLDDLASVHQALCAIISVEKPEATTVAVFWDHEEVGSASVQGADGSFLQHTLSRICRASDARLDTVMARSFLISSDNAHGVLPTHPEKHESEHMPKLGGGPVIKHNANLRYATNDLSAAIFANLCETVGVTYQNFVNRSDMPCGSTIGSIVSPKLGILTVDVGSPQWAMHSIREKMAVKDHYDMYKVFKLFYERNREAVEVEE